MNIIAIQNYSDDEKLDLVNDWIDFKLKGESKLWNYDFYRDLELNKRQLWRFLKYTVPSCYECLNYELILNGCLSQIQDNVEKIAYDYPSFYMMSAIVWALHCFEESLSVKKIVSRWSQILLNIY